MKLRARHQEFRKPVAATEVVSGAQEKALSETDPLAEFLNVTWDDALESLRDLRAGQYSAKEHMTLLADLAVLYPERRGELGLNEELLQELMEKYREALERGSVEECISRAYEIITLFPDQRHVLGLNEDMRQAAVDSFRGHIKPKNSNPLMPYVRLRTVFPGVFEGSKLEQEVWNKGLQFVNSKKGKSPALLLKAAAFFRMAFPDNRHALELDDESVATMRGLAASSVDSDSVNHSYDVQSAVRTATYAAFLFAENVKMTTEGPRIVSNASMGDVPNLPTRSLAA